MRARGAIPGMAAVAGGLLTVLLFQISIAVADPPLQMTDPAAERRDTPAADAPMPVRWQDRDDGTDRSLPATVAAGDSSERMRAVSETWWTRLRRVLLPREVVLVYDLRAFIAAQRPPRRRDREADLRRLDAFYRHAVYLAEGDAALALFALACATLPYHTFPARIPLLGWTIRVPVSTESIEAYNRRMANLPGLLLPDTPPQLDRDKLPHFFGSAWLHCVLRDEDIALAAGELVEFGEEVFKLEGFRDERDIEVNRLGARFGGALMRQRDVLPSHFFRIGE